MPEDRHWPQRVGQTVPYAGMFLLTLLLWLPFGFKTTGLVEEWGVTGLMESGSRPFFITPDSGLASHRMRPFEVFFHAAAYALDPDSFLFYNVFQLLFLAGKTMAVYWLVLQFFPKQRVLALGAGVLSVVYPVDSALFTFRVIHVHAAILAYLIAACLLIRHVRRPDRPGRLALTGAAILLAFSLSTYQIALPIALITPLLLRYFARWSERRLWVSAGAWYAAIGASVLYAVWALHQTSTGSYEMNLLAVNSRAPSATLGGMLEALGLAYRRQLASWNVAWGELGRYAQLRWAAVAAVGLFVGLGGWFALGGRHDRDRNDETISSRRCVIALAVALTIIAVGMAIFLPLPDRRLSDFRIYLISMIGSALVVGLLLFWLSRRLLRFRDAALTAGLVPFVGLGYVNALQQHQHYVNLSLLQQQVLQDTLSQAPGLSPGSVIVVADHDGILDDTFMFGSGLYLPSALKYLYEDPSIDAIDCPIGSTGALNTACVFGSGAVHVTRTGPGVAPLDTIIPADRIVLLADDGESRLKLMTPAAAAAQLGLRTYDPYPRIIRSTPPRRAATLFTCVPAASCRREASGADVSFDLPRAGSIGTGWRAEEPDSAGGTFRWSVNPRSVISVDLAGETDLVVEFKVLDWLDESVMDSLALTVNGATIPLSHEPAARHGRVYRGILPRAVLASQPTRRLVFTVDRLVPVPGAPTVKLGFALNWLRIRPR